MTTTTMQNNQTNQPNTFGLTNNNSDQNIQNNVMTNNGQAMPNLNQGLQAPISKSNIVAPQHKSFTDRLDDFMFNKFGGVIDKIGGGMESVLEPLKQGNVGEAIDNTVSGVGSAINSAFAKYGEFKENHPFISSVVEGTMTAGMYLLGGGLLTGSGALAGLAAKYGLAKAGDLSALGAAALSGATQTVGSALSTAAQKSYQQSLATPNVIQQQLQNQGALQIGVGGNNDLQMLKMKKFLSAIPLHLRGKYTKYLQEQFGFKL